MKSCSYCNHSQAGVALSEFAIALPLLMLILLGLIEVGRLTYFTIQIGNAAHAGAQYGSQSSTAAIDTAGISTAAKNDGNNALSALTVTSKLVCTCWNGTVDNPNPPSNSACGAGCTAGRQITDVQVTVSGTMYPLFNYGALGLPSSWTISRTATSYVLPK